VSDDKYIVFKKEEFDAWFDWLTENITDTFVAPDELEDAVVIRTQDLFAGPALHAYASSIAVVIEVLRQFGHVEQADSLVDVSDYLFQRAEEADAIHGKLPD